MRQETNSYSLLTVLVRGLLEHVVKCDEYNIDTKKESAGAQEIKNHTNTFFRQMFDTNVGGPSGVRVHKGLAMLPIAHLLVHK